MLPFMKKIKFGDRGFDKVFGPGLSRYIKNRTREKRLVCPRKRLYLKGPIMLDVADIAVVLTNVPPNIRKGMSALSNSVLLMCWG